MLSWVRVKNFKSIQDSGKIEIKPITLFIGPNSSGKSSIIQFLLLLKQTSSNPNIQLPLVLNGEYVNLESYRTMIFRHEKKRRLEFEFSFDNEYLRHLRRYIPPSYYKYFQKSEIIYKSVIRFGKTMKLIEFKITSKDSKRQTTTVFHVKFDDRKKKYKILVVGEEDNPIRDAEIIKEIEQNLIPTKFYIYTWVFGLYRFEEKADSEVHNQIRKLDQIIESTRFIDRFISLGIYHIGPLRESPQRYYTIATSEYRHVGEKGENTINVIMSTPQNKNLLEKVSFWLQKFELAKKFEVKPIQGKKILAEALIEDPIQGIIANISDVGFGLSQVLPIIVEGFYAPPGSLLLIEQPEIHLHPKLQSEMADLLIDIAKSQKKKLIIETHSEHIILRLQRRIVEGKISPNDVAIYFFEMTPEGTNIKRISVNELGELENWPEGFFEEDIQESLLLNKERLKKLQQMSLKQ